MILEGHHVVRVAPRTSRDGTKQMWDVGLSDGNDWTTFEGALATFAAGIVNQQGYRFDVELKGGKYKNLNGIFAPGEALPAQPAAPGTTIPAGTTPSSIANGGGPTQVVGNANSATDERMAFFGALKNAVALVGQLYQGAGPEGTEQATEDVKTVTLKFLSAARAAEQGQLVPAEPTILPNDGTPQGVAEAVNEAAGTAAVAVGAGAPAW